MSQPYGSETISPGIIREAIKNHETLEKLELNYFKADKKAVLPFVGTELKWSVGGVETSVMETIEFRVLDEFGMNKIVSSTGTLMVRPRETTTYRIMAYLPHAQIKVGSLEVSVDFTLCSVRDIGNIDYLIANWMDDKAKESLSLPSLRKESIVLLTPNRADLRMSFQVPPQGELMQTWIRWNVRTVFNFKPADETLVPHFFENEVEFDIHPFPPPVPPDMTLILDTRDKLKSWVEANLTELAGLLFHFVPAGRRLVSATIFPPDHSLQLKHMLEFQVVIPELKEEAVGAHN